jgi:hypothetical protein
MKGMKILLCASLFFIAAITFAQSQGDEEGVSLPIPGNHSVGTTTELIKDEVIFEQDPDDPDYVVLLRHTTTMLEKSQPQKVDPDKFSSPNEVILKKLKDGQEAWQIIDGTIVRSEVKESKEAVPNNTKNVRKQKQVQQQPIQESRKVESVEPQSVPNNTENVQTESTENTVVPQQVQQLPIQESKNVESVEPQLVPNNTENVQTESTENTVVPQQVQQLPIQESKNAESVEPQLVPNNTENVQTENTENTVVPQQVQPPIQEGENLESELRQY